MLLESQQWLLNNISSLFWKICMSKQHVLMRDIITQYHPDFKSRSVKRLALSRPELFNVERLIEECMAEIGGYQHVGGEHQDFSDGSDSKTSSIRRNPKKGSQVCYSGQIKNVRTAGGNLKIGALRVVIYNPILQNCGYYFLPRDFWTACVSNGYRGLGVIGYSYNCLSQHIPRFKDYQCESFEHLCRMENQ